MTALSPGQTLRSGQYTIERELGCGRFSISYVAVKPDSTRWVIKVLNPQLIAGLSEAERSLSSRHREVPVECLTPKVPLAKGPGALGLSGPYCTGESKGTRSLAT